MTALPENPSATARSLPVTAATAARQLSDWAIIKRLVRDYLGHRYAALAIAALCMVTVAALSGALAYLLDPITNFIFLQKRAGLLAPLALVVVGVVAVRAIATFGQDNIINGIAERIVSDVQRDMFHSQVGQDIAALNDVHSGELISKFLYDANLLRGAITRGVAGIGLQLITLVVLAGLMIYQDWQLALISVLVLPLVAFVTERLSRSLKRSSTRGMEETGELARTLGEALAGRRIIKAYNLEDYASQIADVRIASRLRYILKAVRARSAAVPATDLIGGIAAAITFAYAGYQGLHGQLSLPQFVSFVTAMILAQQPVRVLSSLWTISTEGLSAAIRIFAVIDAKPQIVDRADAKPFAIAPPPLGGAIRFDNVSFAYHEGAAALERISMDIPPGKKIALVGPSGAGKSTIFNLLLRFYDVDAGAIAIDGQDIRDVTLSSLRDHIALVTQEAILFDDTVADNIALGRRDATRDEIIAAAKAAAADGFIRELANGYDTGIGEGGLKLSGGQRQRLAIARAMLRNAPILLLDEATSALDTESERQVQDALAVLMKGRTTLVIAHRLSTVLDADRIYVLDRGKVVEAGTHAELVARKGLYARLYRHNLDGAADDVPAAAVGS